MGKRLFPLKLENVAKKVLKNFEGYAIIIILHIFNNIKSRHTLGKNVYLTRDMHNDYKNVLLSI